MPVPALVFLRFLVILGFRVWGITWIPKKRQNHCPKPLKTGGATILHILGGSGTTDKIVISLGLFVLGTFFFNHCSGHYTYLRRYSYGFCLFHHWCDFYCHCRRYYCCCGGVVLEIHPAPCWIRLSDRRFYLYPNCR